MTNPNRPPGLIQRYREELQARHYARRTVKSYEQWLRRFLRFHGMRHPREMGSAEMNAFLTHLAVAGQVSASTQNQALSAVLFLYRELLKRDLDLEGVVRACKPCQPARRKSSPLCINNCDLQLVSRQDWTFPLSPTPFRLIAATPATALLWLYAIP
ncbi:MAG: phage integrase N-terminal SAM-like domain-containing protein [Cyanobacteriota bacterium]|nr:phage integrase N-terminal SAM-like domain-containing protein [Cyanobacteriota bacterium]